MNVAGWYVTHHNAALQTKTRLTCFALIGCTLFNWVSCTADRQRQLSCVGEGVYIATQLKSTQLDVELSCVAINGPLKVSSNNFLAGCRTQLSQALNWISYCRAPFLQ